MADQFKKGGVVTGGPTHPITVHPGEYAVTRDLELRVKGRGLRRFFSYRIATFPALITRHGMDSDYIPADLMRDVADALREAADAFEPDTED